MQLGTDSALVSAWAGSSLRPPEESLVPFVLELVMSRLELESALGVECAAELAVGLIVP